ncbi:sporulation associated protein [Streptomyces albidoflavus]|uniref:sporulation associated protein n=1 Tax=Streptomyces albidoflavus TaxID=1886 RepID=UPI0013EE9472|nr:sporulation associated protein [Streptomyces albidoflavus]
MARWQERDWQPNEDLARLVAISGASYESLAKRVNALAEQAGRPTDYTHTSVTNWVQRGMIPRAPAPACIAAALGERLGRRVDLSEIGMTRPRRETSMIGLDFPRSPSDAVRGAIAFWRLVDLDRRKLLRGSFAVGAFALATTRWLAVPAAATPPTEHHGARRVGQNELAELWDAVEDARIWDSRFGGGNWKASSVATCLKDRAAPMLQGSYSEKIGHDLLRVTAELSRVVGWSAFDAGQHDAAQRYLIQALAMARAAGDIQVGAYVLSTMSLSAFLRRHPGEAVDMAEGAYERAKHVASPKVLSFAKLAQARAHARAGEGPEATAALLAAERHLAGATGDDPAWMNYYTPERIATDATEIHRDLGATAAALDWGRQAAAMSPGRYTRAVGIRLAVEASTHLRAGDREQGLDAGRRSVDLLAEVRSARAHGYVHDLTATLAPHRSDPEVDAFIAYAERQLAA